MQMAKSPASSLVFQMLAGCDQAKIPLSVLDSLSLTTRAMRLAQDRVLLEVYLASCFFPRRVFSLPFSSPRTTLFHTPEANISSKNITVSIPNSVGLSKSIGSTRIGPALQLDNMQDHLGGCLLRITSALAMSTLMAHTSAA